MASNFPPCPPSLKINAFIKTATEHDGRDVIISYWCRLHALQVALANSTKQTEETAFLLAVMDWLETCKKENSGNEAIMNEVVAQAHLENYALKLFQYADRMDRAGEFGKNVVKAFFTSGMLYDVLQTFGELSEEATQNRKYAKWKAAYIHNCLKNGETPKPGPLDDSDMDGAVGGEETGGDGSEATSGSNEQSPADQKPFSPPPTAAEVLKNPDILPKPPVDEERSPGGFIPYIPPAQSAQSAGYVPPPVNAILTPAQIQQAQKYCKYAGSALNFDDVKSAIENLTRGLHLLQTGQEMAN